MAKPPVILEPAEPLAILRPLLEPLKVMEPRSSWNLQQKLKVKLKIPNK
jgi:hypothetical protein